MRISKTMRGITLLELMIVLIVISILITIAFPNYREFTARAKRAEAKAQLLEIATNQERYYLSTSRYGTLSDLGYTEPLVTASGSYTVSIRTNNTVEFTATAIYNHTDSELGRCATFTLDGLGNKTSTGSIGNCWTDQR